MWINTTRNVILSMALLLSVDLAHAQGIPVIDQSAIAKQIESITQLKSQLDTLRPHVLGRQGGSSRIMFRTRVSCRARASNIGDEPWSMISHFTLVWM
ncbi:hypothetical protein GA0061102_10742 [Rhizobium miluonense]|uniref:Uncharacterized protein n=1 Tax=Rhizobium miluonense TaxID=411945 RepID=A0A1C3XAX9_9HYPH|nr:hypothetical protein GA0061102_10742 [Rhizobium miluonense]